jgi:hypothetical protein
MTDQPRLRGIFAGYLPSAASLALVASRIRIRAICEMVRSSFAAITSRTFRISGSKRREMKPVCFGCGPGGMARIYHAR